MHTDNSPSQEYTYIGNQTTNTVHPHGRSTTNTVHPHDGSDFQYCTPTWAIRLPILYTHMGNQTTPWKVMMMWSLIVSFSSRLIGSSLPICGVLKMYLARAGKIMLRDRSWRQMVTASGRNLTLKNCLMIGQERLVSHSALHIVFHIKIKRNKSWLFITGSGSVKWSNRWMLSVWLTDNNVTDCE